MGQSEGRTQEYRRAEQFGPPRATTPEERDHTKLGEKKVVDNSRGVISKRKQKTILTISWRWASGSMVKEDKHNSPIEGTEWQNCSRMEVGKDVQEF